MTKANYIKIAKKASSIQISELRKVNKVFNLSVTVSWVFKNATISDQIASIFDKPEFLKGYRYIFKLKELGGGNIPLFLVHPGGGGAECYRQLVTLFNNLNKHISGVYGVESYNINHLDQSINDLKLLAKQYIEYI